MNKTVIIVIAVIAVLLIVGVVLFVVFKNRGTGGTGGTDDIGIFLSIADSLTSKRIIEYNNITVFSDDIINKINNLSQPIIAVNLPKAIEFGNNAFSCNNSNLEFGIQTPGCFSLTDVKLPNAKKFGNNAFEGCISLYTINLPKAEVFGDNAFKNGGLEIAYIPNAKKFGDNAFLNNYSLDRIVTDRVIDNIEFGDNPFNTWR